MGAETGSAEPSAATSSPDEPAPWPDEAAESAYLSDQRESPQPPTVAAGEKEEDAEAPDPAALPSMQSLIDRIPPQARETLEDLFRAKFITVRRVPKKVLKEKA